MATYRRTGKVEAEQFDGVNLLPTMEMRDGCPMVMTQDGWMPVAPRDWVITGGRGYRWPCPPSVFEKSYEPVE